jgi:hypothetical protein
MLVKIVADPAQFPPNLLTRISYRLSAATRDKAVSTSLRLVSVLDILLKYAGTR